jgi:NAD(P)-dependent dehydrogenase (short-subunit alcohol dehydrogenase family)
VRLPDKVTVITGAASGIGRGSALVFGREGARVVVSDIQAEAGRETAATIRAAGGTAMFVRCDVTSPDQVRELFAETVATWGRVDVVFANAGVGGFATRLVDISEERWRRLLEVNLTGPFLCMKYGIPRMIESGGGSIILTASIGGLAAFPGSAAYSAAKGGIVAMARTAAIEYAADGVRVNAICPGYIETPLSGRFSGDDRSAFWAKLASDTPLGRMGLPEDIARVALFLASDESAYVTGIAIPVDGGVVAGNISPGWPIQKDEPPA